MALSTAGRNAAAGGVAAVVGYVSLHTADPGSSGTGEVAGGTYARKAITWAAASSGVATSNGTDPVFDVPAATTVTHYGFWSAATAGTYYGGGALSASEAFGGAGTYTLDTATITAT